MKRLSVLGRRLAALALAAAVLVSAAPRVYADDKLDSLRGDYSAAEEKLNQIKEQIIDAQASIEFGIEDDFYQAIYRFGERLEHIADIENLRLSNLY